MSTTPRRSRLLAAPLTAGLLVLVSSTALAVAPLQRRDGALDPDLVPARDGRVPVIVETADAAGLAARIAEVGGVVTHVFANVDAVSALVPEGALAALDADARVVSVQRQRYVRQAVSEPSLTRALQERGLRPDRTRVRSGAGATRSLDVPGARFVPVSPGALRGDGGPESTFLGYEAWTRAAEVWGETDHGEGALVAIIDSGVFPGHPLIEGSVVGGENLVPAEEEEAIDVDGDGFGDGLSFDWDALENDDHGTFCAGLVAGHADLELPADDELAQSIAYHAPDAVETEGDVTRVRLFGTAPAASIYAIKVFPFRGGSAPDARIGEALDRLITAKRCGTLDVDVISMSLSGPVLNDGRYFLDRLVDAAARHGMVPVVAASNEGPSQVSVGSPGSAFRALTVGGTIDPMHLRVAIEALFGLPVGSGDVVYPHELQVVDFAARGLTADGRVKPEIVASALFAFSATLADFSGDGIPDAPSFGFGSGTSFSTPTVAGAAALAAVANRCAGHFDGPRRIANALVRGATPIADYDRVSAREQGGGFLVLPAALELLEHPGSWQPARLDPRDPTTARLSLRGGTASGDAPALAAGETFDFYVEIPDDVGVVHLRFPSVTHTGEENPFLGDGLSVFVHSAKRGGSGDYVFVAPSLAPGDAFDWTLPEPGRARITFEGALQNYGEVAGSVEMWTEPLELEADEVFRGVLAHDGRAAHEVEVPAGTTAVGARLLWKHDWSRFPTVDLDMYVFGPDGIVPAASLDSPELVWIEAPAPGPWTFRLLDFSTVRGREPYRLEVVFAGREARTESDEVLEDRPAIVAATPRAGAPGADIRFTIPAAGRISLDVFDVGGRRVRTVDEGLREAGAHATVWDGRDEAGRGVASGVYFARLATDAGSSTRKLVLSR